MPLNVGRRRSRGVVLLVVLFFSLLLAATVASFLRRATVDTLVARNRDEAARAAALARGGVQIAAALLLQDRIDEAASGRTLDGSDDLWFRIADFPLQVAPDATLRLRVEDTGARFNLNALFELDGDGARKARTPAEEMLTQLLERVIGNMPIDPAERMLYDPRELAQNLIDFSDSDDVRIQGGPEDAYYQEQEPPYRAWNGPFLSVEDLALVEGFDRPLVEALREYVTVYPLAPGGCARPGIGCGVNLNTAPPHVLFTLFYDDGVTARLADQEVVRNILRAREGDRPVCAPGQPSEECTPLNEILVNPPFPEPTFSSEIFHVRSEARVGDVERGVVAVLDRSQPTVPRLLSWRVY
jgi:type II secretory pathway component PulK